MAQNRLTLARNPFSELDSVFLTVIAPSPTEETIT